MEDNEYISIIVQEYGFHSAISLGLLHLSMGYVCQDPDTCPWCNRPAFVPPALTSKQKAQRWWSNKKYSLGKALSSKAKDLGYYEDCDCDY